VFEGWVFLRLRRRTLMIWRRSVGNDQVKPSKANKKLKIKK